MEIGMRIGRGSAGDPFRRRETISEKISEKIAELLLINSRKTRTEAGEDKRRPAHAGGHRRRPVNVCEGAGKKGADRASS
ncbi:hypothetical protein IPZ58_02465 [Streptomyces roseoverticillatus]|uniref:hypothetical protein n=1 Tax=Streptomyces roseoverticillatus TaxID=66429 RepID=UPI001F222011|nr:hypothetical protein [Streptomyces roseoverticillatus]MCF3100445.1 hypothetical protein [Streptomyces roseoverticillatus]